MNYITTLNIVFMAILCVIGVCFAHFVVFGIVGVFKKKTFKPAKIKHKYGIVVAARNEEKVIGNLIKSIRAANYPQKNLKIFICAHNCTDNTFNICKDLKGLGVNVFKYNNEEEKTKGYALSYLFKKIKQYKLDAGIEGYYVLDADNVVDGEFFNKMNDAFEENGPESIITSFRNAKNFSANAISGLYGIYFALGCDFYSRGRTACGCSARIFGTGYLVGAPLLKDGWNTHTLTEDLELTANHILSNRKVVHCDEAEFFDEQPTSFKIMWRQRVRWSKGMMVVCKQKFIPALKSLCSTKSRKQIKGSTYDLLTNITPICLISALLTIAQCILTLLAPAFTNISFGVALLEWLKSFGITCLMTYLGGLFIAIVVFIMERKRISGLTFAKKLQLTLLWPLFMAAQFVIDLVAFFSKVTWKPIPHVDTKTIEDLTIAKTK